MRRVLEISPARQRRRGRPGALAPSMLLALLSALGAFGHVAGADRVVTLPRGWTPHENVFAARAEAVAVALHPPGDDVESRVMQVRGSTITYTDVVGRVGALEYSEDAKHLLVHHGAPADGPDPRAALVSAAGRVLWTATDTRFYRFTGDGRAVWSAPSYADGAFSGSVLDLEGHPIARWTLAVRHPAELHGATFPEGPEDLVVAVGGQVKRLRLSDAGMTSVWERDLPTSCCSGFRRMLSTVSPGVIEADYGLGDFDLISSGGVTLFAYRPAELAAANRGSTEPQPFAELHPFRDRRAGRVLMLGPRVFGGVLDLRRGTFTPREFDVSTPRGFRHPGYLRDGRAVLLGESEIRIRAY